MVNNDWYGQQIVSDDVPLIDAGEGKAVILRDFRFVMVPNMLIPTKQMLFNSHWPYIKDRLWADGLEANQNFPPRVVIGKYAYRIFIVCEVKGGKARESRMKDKAVSLNKILKVDNSKK